MQCNSTTVFFGTGTYLSHLRRLKKRSSLPVFFLMEFRNELEFRNAEF